MTLKAMAHPNGSYKFLPAISAYSAGIATMPGFEITAIRITSPLSLEAGFEVIDNEISKRGLKSDSLAGIQLRSPKVFSFNEFSEFNDKYRNLLLERSLILGDVNPIPRTNVIPIKDVPPIPCIATAFLVHPSQNNGGDDFIVAGAGEVAGTLDPTNIVARGDISDSGMSLKVDCVLEEMLARLLALGFDGLSPTVINVYTIHEILKLQELISKKLPAINVHGYTSWLTKPPVTEIEFEMDCSRFSNWRAV